MNALHFCAGDGLFGDPMPLYYNGVYHIYYTKLYHSENRNLVWGHLVSKDMINFEEKPDPFAENDPGAPVNTGCVFAHNGKFHAYYYGMAPSGKPAIFHAKSDNPDSFSYSGDICFVRPEKHYRQDDTWRDPFVFYHKGEFHMVFCAKAPDTTGADNCAGVIGHAVSKDLKQWQCLPPLSPKGLGGHPECPQIFSAGKRLGLVYYWRETRFRTAKNLNGPWKRARVLSPDGFDFNAARILNDGRRDLLLGWISKGAVNADDRPWGGYMLFPRELTFGRGHTPQTRFAEEVYTLFSHKTDLTPQNAVCFGDGWRRTESTMAVNAAIGGRSAAWRNLPERALITATVKMKKPGVVLFLLGAHQSNWLGEVADLENGTMLEISTAEGIARIYRHGYWQAFPNTAATPLPKNLKTLSVEILTDGNILEVNINCKRTMAVLLTEPCGGNLVLRVEDTSAHIQNFAVYTEPQNQN